MVAAMTSSMGGEAAMTPLTRATIRRASELSVLAEQAAACGLIAVSIALAVATLARLYVAASQ